MGSKKKMHRGTKMNEVTEKSGLIRLDPADNVAVATKTLTRGEEIELGGTLWLLPRIFRRATKLLSVEPT